MKICGGDFSEVASIQPEGQEHAEAAQDQGNVKQQVPLSEGRV